MYSGAVGLGGHFCSSRVCVATSNAGQRNIPVGADSLARVTRAIDEFQGYVGGNRRSVPSFAKARAARRRISTAHVESVMNHLINHRMSKKQQMRWSPAGAHSLLQGRVERLNGTLLDRFRV